MLFVFTGVTTPFVVQTQMRPHTSRCTRVRQARQPAPQSRRLETFVQNRNLVVRQIGELVKTHFERENANIGIACGLDVS